MEMEVLPEGVFGNVSFQEMYLANDNLQSIHPSALLPSKDRLEILRMEYCHLTDFPFEIIPGMKALKHLYLYKNSLTSAPVIRSDSLEILHLFNNRIAFLPEGGWSMPNLQEFHIGENNLEELPHGIVTSMEKLIHFRAQDDQFGPELRRDFLEFNSPNLNILYLHGNSISSLEAGAITGLSPNTTIFMTRNAIEELHEASFKPMVEILAQGTGILNLYGMTKLERNSVASHSHL
ncbi:unnamed protein product [Darwinula stevensoni]|uniref:Uncharacterized protein n=1 Tax=Darwinula stevensoni TaxID=69355 RepID=A0A7R8XH36_9CRUS|nr:unnamed protein product [Darwinula stevensoni]CAG0892364.1 unnamed protein product [Darwinula stevensoni]